VQALLGTQSKLVASASLALPKLVTNALHEHAAAMAEGGVADTVRKWWTDFKSDVKNASTKFAAAPPAAAPTPEAGSLSLPLGPFDATDSVLGEGGYAKVVLGRNRNTGEKVAIKLLDTRADAASGRAASSEAAIVREVAALRRAGAHPNVCQLLGYYRLGKDGDVHAMVMELCGGGELFRLVERFGAVEERRVLPLFVGVLAGLRHLHAQGIAHRDLKLENILLARVESGKGGTSTVLVPKIADLGLAHAHARGADGQGWAERELTQFCGSRSYCAPEVLARLGYNGYLADVWSLGVCLFGLVSGFFPTDEATSRDWRFERIARQQHVAPELSTVSTIYGFYQRPCPLSPALVQLLDGMLQVAPARRLRLDQVAAAPWVHGHTVLPTAKEGAAPQPPGAAVVAPPAAATAPPTAAAAPPAEASVQCDFLIDVEVDLSDQLQRGDEYRSALPDDPAGPPMIRRQRAEECVGMVAGAL